MSEDYRLIELDNLMAKFMKFWNEETEGEKWEPHIQNLAFVSFCAGHKQAMERIASNQ